MIARSVKNGTPQLSQKDANGHVPGSSLHVTV